MNVTTHPYVPGKRGCGQVMQAYCVPGREDTLTVRCGFPETNRAVHAPGARLPLDLAALNAIARTVKVPVGLVLPQPGTLRRDLLQAIATANLTGLTDDEAEVLLGHGHQSVSPASTHLRAAQLIEALTDDDGVPLTRATRSGRPATVWTPTPLGWLLLTQEAVAA